MLYSIHLFSIIFLNACFATTQTKAANVVSVEVSKSGKGHAFNVGISSPDTGCKQYANWWEVVSEEGKLIYRRILTHSHVDEQPFVRSGIVKVMDTQEVWIRAHMYPTGYGGSAFYGSVANGFKKMDLDKSFFSYLAKEDPLPDGCRF